MDKVDRYRQLICSLLTKRASLRSPNEPVKSQTVFDTKSDRYLLVHVGWKDSVTRIYGCIIQVDIIDGKIWVQYDGTEEAIADELAENGVDKQAIVLAYHSPYMRQFTEFAVG